MNRKIDCHNLKQLFSSSHNSKELLQELPRSTHPTSEVHGDVVLEGKLLLDVKTYICANGHCTLHHNRSHRRISNYNLNKMQKFNPRLDVVIKIAKEIIFLWVNKTRKCQYSNETLNSGGLRIRPRSTHNLEENKLEKVEKCEYCQNTRIKGIKHVHFVRATTTASEEKKIHEEKYKPIETVFTIIDGKAEDNNIKIKTAEAEKAPGAPILQPNSYRMTYGDLNYLGSNKAILYFDRGIRGKQMYTNSMYPLEKQPKHKDIIVVDDIVFTAPCKCDSILQHREMFPHYRVTCAVGLTCPARLSKIERIIYARNRNATTETFTTARSMLIRYW